MDKINIFALSLLLFAIFSNCGDSKKPTKPYTLGAPMLMIEKDIDKDKKAETRAYYLNDPSNYRIVYAELDNNIDGISDTMVWLGLSSASPKGRAEKDIVKVHVEEDENKNGKVDHLRWYLPNDFIAMAQEDSDEDGYFETVLYYGYNKEIMRREKDSNFDGKPDIIIWNNRGEVDTDFDGTPDKVVLAKGSLVVREKIAQKQDLAPLLAKDSWFLNPNLTPMQDRTIIGSGYFY